MKYEEIVDKIKKEFPEFKLSSKEDSRFMQLLSSFFYVVSFGKVDNFLTQYTTTIGNKIYVPKSWQFLSDKHKVSILRHELIHMRQMKKYSTPIFLAIYLFFPLPFCLSWFRARFEWEAYEESLLDEYELHGDKFLLSKEYKETMVQLFIGPSYGWMWPFRKQIEKWYDLAVERIISH